jgi:hypothetical protein
MNNEQLIGAITPTVYIKKVTLESPSDNSTRVIINVVVKDVVENKRKTSWFREQEFSKIIKIKIIQSIDPITHNLLSDRNNNNAHILAIDPQKYFSKGKGPIVDHYYRNTEHRLASLANSYEGSLQDQDQEVDSDGNIITNFNYKFEFNLDTPQPENLSYFCFSYIDAMEFQEAFGIEIPSNFDKLNGKISSDTVFSNSELVSTSTAYYDDKNNIWAGPVHQMPDGRFMAGSTHSENEQYLTERRVPNTKIQDFRIVARLSDAQIDLSILEPVSFDYGKKGKILRNDDSDVYKKQSYFTNAWTSRDENNNSNFLFGFDVKNFIKYNSRFGKLLENALPSTIAEIINLSPIREMKVYRKRIKNTPNVNSLGTYERPEERFDDLLESDKTLLVTGEAAEGIRSIDNDSAYINEERDLNMLLGGPSSHCRYFSVSDRKLKDFTYGLYQYGVELKLEDGTVAYLQNLLSRLKDCKKLLSSYLSEAPIGYNAVAQKFSSRFVTQQNNKYQTLQNSPWIKPVVEYLNAFYILTGDRSVLDKAQGLSNFISPSGGNLEALEAFVLQYDKLLTSLHDLLGHTSSVRGSQGLLPGSSEAAGSSYSHGSSRIPLFLGLQHWFVNAPIDAESFSTSGISYFPIDNSNSFRSVSTDEFLQRRQFEREKIAREEQLMDLASSFSILSPSYIKVGGVVGSEDNTKDLVDRVLSANFPGILKEVGVSISNSKKPTLIPLVLQQTSLNELVYSVNSPPNVARNIDLEVELINEEPADMPMAQQTSLNQFQSEFLIQMVESNQPKKSTGYPGPPRPAAMAEVLDDAAAGVIAPTFADVDLSWIYNIDWALIREIKVLTGYQTSALGDKMLKGEIWETLTNQLYAEDRFREKTLICKFVPYSSEEIGIKYNNNLELPTYNEYFLLQGAPRISIDTPDLAAVGPMVTTHNDRTVRPKTQDRLASNYRTSNMISSEFITSNFGGVK